MNIHNHEIVLLREAAKVVLVDGLQSRGEGRPLRESTFYKDISKLFKVDLIKRRKYWFEIIF